MIHANRSALICDLAETYGIYDYRALPMRTVATLSAGLRANSRIKKNLSGIVNDLPEDFILGLIADYLRAIYGYFNEKAVKIESVLSLLQKDFRTENKTRAYRSSSDWEQAKERILRG